MTKDQSEFVDYIEQTLIPDLRRCGKGATADNFRDLVAIIRQLDAQPVTKARNPKKEGA